MNIAMKRIVIRKTLDSDGEMKITDLLSLETGLSRSRIKDAMSKGAVWTGKGKKMHRLRRASTVGKKGMYVEMHYDERLLSVTAPQAKCLLDRKAYSGWFKPAGLMSQGTLFGDHCSITRQAEQYFAPRRDIFPVHRLDREVAGVMIIAHSRKAAAALSGLFRENKVEKRYRAELLGNISAFDRKGTIEIPLDGKHAETRYTVLSFSPDTNTSFVEIELMTGRFHQIRRHFDMIGYPVLGDPRYGNGNKNREGLKLEAVSLRFICPLSGKDIVVAAPGR